jgi:hypothetical protein
VEGISLGGNCSWYSGFLSFLSRFSATRGWLVPVWGICQSPNARHSPGLRFMVSVAGVTFRLTPVRLRRACSASTSNGLQPRGPLADPTALVRASDLRQVAQNPPYVRYTAGIKRDRLCALTCFRLSAHFLEVKTMTWARPRLPGAERVCGLCGSGVGDELHMVIKCPEYQS